MLNLKPVVLKRYASSIAAKFPYEVRFSRRDGVIYCTCPGWTKTWKRPRTCSHLQHYEYKNPKTYRKYIKLGKMIAARVKKI